jgi:hypothetical protein
MIRRLEPNVIKIDVRSRAALACQQHPFIFDELILVGRIDVLPQVLIRRVRLAADPHAKSVLRPIPDILDDFALLDHDLIIELEVFLGDHLDDLRRRKELHVTFLNALLVPRMDDGEIGQLASHLARRIFVHSAARHHCGAPLRYGKSGRIFSGPVFGLEPRVVVTGEALGRFQRNHKRKEQYTHRLAFQ